MRLLLVEDEKRMAEALCELLRLEKYDVDHYADGPGGLDAALTGAYDLIILDVMLPGKNGFDIAREVRKNGVKTPVLMLTAKSEVDDKVTGLDCGADDYLTKPFMTKELLARLRALGRRNRNTADGALRYGDLTLNKENATLTCGENSVRLSEKEAHILEYLIANQGQILTREQLAVKIWGYDSDTEYNNVEVYMSFTRKKLNFVKSKAEIKAVRTVYASTMDISALEYRKQRGLQHTDEQMAVLVQRVSGSYHGDLFFPTAAGVGYSYSSYRWNKYMDPAAGLLRIVTGLGTRAVDRPDHDYPRLANLDRPDVHMQNSAAERHRFSQRIMDVLDTGKNELTAIEIDSLLESLPLWFKKAVMERDYDAESALKRMNRRREVWFADCQGLLENRNFTGLMQKVLKTLDRVYGNPVDIEYTVNLDEQGAFVVNLLQCRPLYTGGRGTDTEIPELPEKDVFFRLKDSAVGSSEKVKIDVVVEIDAKAYYEYPYALKPRAAETVGAVNAYHREKGKNLLLMTPGRVGTSSPELGVPVSFAQISGFRGICEVSDSRAGYMPELSYGSHMFQDLVEAGIFYCALWGDDRTVKYDRTFFEKLPDLFEKICPDRKELAGMFRVTEPEDLWYWNNEQAGETLCGRQLQAEKAPASKV